MTVTPTTYDGGAYNGWVPFAQIINTSTSDSDLQPSADGNQHLYFFGGELFNNYPWVFGWPDYGIIPAQSIQLNTTGITATTVASTTYTATIQVANPLCSTVVVNGSHATSAALAPYNLVIDTPTFELDIVANGQVVASNTLVDPPVTGGWYTLTTTWPAASVQRPKSSSR